jgi:hypothetical protein
MITGKILTRKRDCLGPMPWYDWLAERTDYIQLDSIGMDLNFNKHGAHGLELRIFDQIPYDTLDFLLKRLIHIMDASLALKKVEDPRKHLGWSSMAGWALLNGRGWKLSVEEQELLYSTFQITDIVCKEPMYVEDVWTILCIKLERYKGVCWKRMVAMDILKSKKAPCS